MSDSDDAAIGCILKKEEMINPLKRNPSMRAQPPLKKAFRSEAINN